MARSSNEQNLVNDFVNNCIRNLTNKPIILKGNVNTKSDCDLEFMYKLSGKNYTFCLEVKSDKSSNKSNNVLLIMGDILKNRLLKAKKGNFGIFMDFDSTKGNNSFFVDRIKKSYDPSDWNSFGKKYKCKYIFFYDSRIHECYYCKWKGFINSEPIFTIMI